jgi:hypothetical protein
MKEKRIERVKAWAQIAPNAARNSTLLKFLQPVLVASSKAPA